MSNHSNQAASLLQLLECQICSEIFNEDLRTPKVLPCQHTFCLACMRKLGHHEFRQNEGVGPVILRLVLKCPVCSVEYDAPDNDVKKYPNNITMIGFLGMAPPADNALNPKSTTASQDDLKRCLQERVERLRDQIAESKTSYAVKLSTWDKELDDAKKVIRSHCLRFKQAVDQRESALITELEEAATKRSDAYQEETIVLRSTQLSDMEDFCEKMERDLKCDLSDTNVTQKLVRCVGYMETLDGNAHNGGGDGPGGARSDGAQWKVKFFPNRRDNVYSSITMFGQVNSLDPRIKISYQLQTIPESFLIQPLCLKPPLGLADL